MLKCLLEPRRFVIVGCLLCLASLAEAVPPSNAAEPGAQLLQQMSGTWDVKQWMWSGPGAPPVELPAGVAERRLVEGKFLEERMTSVPGVADAFSRISYFDYNPVSGQYEYFSIDTRAPQMMNERGAGPVHPGDAIELQGGTFVAPQWGAAIHVSFRYRIVLGPIQGNTQTVELYLTPMPAGRGEGFLAFRYLYTRRAAAGT